MEGFEVIQIFFRTFEKFYEVLCFKYFKYLFSKKKLLSRSIKSLLFEKIVLLWRT